MTVAVVAICGGDHLERCLQSLSHQSQTPGFEVVVAVPPRLMPDARVVSRHPGVRFVSHAADRTPVDLAALALRESRGQLVLLTEDHCEAAVNWVVVLSAAVVANARTCGGSLAPRSGLSPFDWAFFFVDFHPYLPTRPTGDAHSLSVCNVAYDRDALESLSQNWTEEFHETRIHDELRGRAGDFLFLSDARLTTGRHVGWTNGHSERYRFGRLFAAGRWPSSTARRMLYGAASPLLPALLMLRMSRAAFRDRQSAARFLRALPHVFTLVGAWCAGEMMGYLTGRPPSSTDAAPEVARRAVPVRS